MRIVGLQKMTLLDYPGRVACTVFLGGCNFRCPFCHNSELLDGSAEPVMDVQELLAFLEKRKGLLDGVCITGGEPTLQKDLPELLSAIKALGYAVKLDTNGYRPEILKDLVGQGLVDYVAMDVKNSPQRYAETAGLPGLDIARIEESLAFLLSGAVDYELRTTVAEPLHDRQAMEDIAGWIDKISPNQKARRFFIQPFVDRDTVMFAGLRTPEKPELMAFQGILANCAEQVSIRGDT
jgi:pyruvate formate lyase activating enzyme